MSGTVITLDGLANANVRKGFKSCGKVVTVISPVTDNPVQICSNDAKLIAESQGISIDTLRRKPGRPRGTTAKKGAKRPRVSPCSEFKIVMNRKGRKTCRCISSGNSQIQTNKKCGL